MTDDLISRYRGARERVIVFLAFLSSEACREAFRSTVRQEDWASALLRVWFDEIYAPGDTYLNGLKGARRQTDVNSFEAAFDECERAVLARFHGCLELRLDLLSNRAQGRGHIPENDSWRSIVRDARAALSEVEPDPRRLQDLLAALVQHMATPGAALPWLRGVSE